MATSASDGPVDEAHWSERRWARGLGGRRGRPLGLVVLVVALAAILGPEVRALHLLRLAVFDAYQFRAPRERVSAPAVIVDVDEASIAEYGQWPWPRTLLARLISLIAAGDPAAIGLDVVMPEPDRLSPDRLARLVERLDPTLAERLGHLPSNDRALAAAIAERPVVLGVAAVEEPMEDDRPRVTTPVRVTGGDAGSHVRPYPGERRSLDEIDRAARGHGLLNAIVEDGVVRRMPAVALVGDVLIPTLGIEMLRVAAGEPGFGVEVGAMGVEAVRVGDVVVPTQADGGVWLRYSRHDPARFVSAGDVLAREVDVRTFEGKLVLIGVTALGLTDSQATPVGERMPGVEIHAQLIENIYDGALLARPWWTTWLEAGLLIVAGLAVIAIVPVVSVTMSGLLAAVLSVATIGIGFALYLWWGVLFDAAGPVLGIGLLFTAMLGTTLTDVQSQRRALRRQVVRQREAAARLAGELEAARRIQLGSLPHPDAVFPGERRFDLYAYLEPARAVGGDLYDFFRLDDDRIFVLVGDVAGKGVPGSLFMTVSKSLCKSIALRGARTVAAVMRDADREIARDNAEGLFVTLWAAIMDVVTGDVEYGSAGHDSPYLLRPDGGPFGRLEASGGPPLCVVDEFPYEASRYRMSRGEMLCVITDGVTEAMSATGELYGRERLESLLNRIPPGVGPQDVGEQIRRDVAKFAAGAEPADDIAILILRWNGPPETAASPAH